MTKLVTVAEIDIPADLRDPPKIIEYKGSTERREPIVGTAERILDVRYSEEVHGKLDAIYANGIRFTPDATQ